jgi:hypothetical protein
MVTIITMQLTKTMVPDQLDAPSSMGSQLQLELACD